VNLFFRSHLSFSGWLREHFQKHLFATIPHYYRQARAVFPERRMKMILLYTMLLFLLGAINFLVIWRARAMERNYARDVAELEAMLRELEYKPGNSNKFDPCITAKRTLILGALVQKRDRVETKYFAWQRRADRVGAWVKNLLDWKGKKLPYTLGAVDVWLLFGLIDYAGVGEYLSMQTAFYAAMTLWESAAEPHQLQ